MSLGTLRRAMARQPHSSCGCRPCPTANPGERSLHKEELEIKEAATDYKRRFFSPAYHQPREGEKHYLNNKGNKTHGKEICTCKKAELCHN